MNAPYSDRDGWIIKVERKGGRLFLNVVSDEEDRSGDKRFLYWGSYLCISNLT
jgi:hypothetical protein